MQVDRRRPGLLFQLTEVLSDPWLSPMVAPTPGHTHLNQHALDVQVHIFKTNLEWVWAEESLQREWEPLSRWLQTRVDVASALCS